MGGDLHNPINVVEITKMPEFRHNPFKYRIGMFFTQKRKKNCLKNLTVII